MTFPRIFTVVLVVLALMVGLSACREAPVPASPEVAATAVPTAATAVPTAATAVTEPASPTDVLTSEQPTNLQTAGVYISELLAGVPGSNATEFIELYNAGQEPVNLQGWSLRYLLNSGDDETLIIQWPETAVADIPGYGHYLLVHEGQDVGMVPDAFFAEPLFERRGGLILRDAAGQVVDSLGWGEDAPETAVSGQPAAIPEPGGSLERLPGGAQGNGMASGDNAADFVAATVPNPQNSGSEMTPLPADRLSITLQAPETITPGTEFGVTAVVENLSTATAVNTQVILPLPDYLEIAQLPADAAEMDGGIQWTIGDLAAGDSAQAEIMLLSPFTYIDMLLGGYFAAADGLPRTYGPVRQVAVAGGAIPIAAARTLIGSEVTIEGTATMYTGGYFAGTTGTKFYLEDDSGGIQVYVPGGMGLIDVAIGDQVRVKGGIEVYRDSLEIIPTLLPDDVEILAQAADDGRLPTPITILQNETDESAIGRLTVLEGTATRIDEFSFSYEIDLTDEAGNTTLVYIEKETGATPELMELGQKYRITGISEFYSTVHQIKPRLQADISEIYPPVVLVDMSTATSALPGETVTVTIAVRNYTERPLTQTVIIAQAPDGSEPQTWSIDDVAAGGGRAEVQYNFTLPDDAAGSLTFPPAEAQFADQAEPAASEPFVTYVGTAVPIGAIQGTGDRSPYVAQTLTAEGVVTAVFPDLGGFWLQSAAADADPATSEGLFVLADAVPADLAVGD
ncbi:MAG: lamin tail domain-containing protein, partial [Chloroflexi bacterium]|nr:lamin tail domain-containing protein [Chloroflexota bacterium]